MVADTPAAQGQGQDWARRTRGAAGGWCWQRCPVLLGDVGMAGGTRTGGDDPPSQNCEGVVLLMDGVDGQRAG